jgi:pyruvate/2-oxoglutarate dehydrogenase complex dihydrolipoamide acyltransferase (E2) component
METFDAQPHGWDEGPGLLQSVWRYNWLIATAALLGALLGWGWAARQPTLYQGVSRLIVSDPGSVTSPGGGAPSGDPDRYLRNQAALIGSTPVLQRAATLSKVAGASADTLGGQLTVDVEQDSDVITISVLDPTPEGAASLANAVGAAYQGYVADRSRQAAEQVRRATSQLEGRLAEIDAELATATPPEAASLRRERDAIEERLKTNADRIAANLDSAGSDPVQLQEKAAVPGRPSLPATRRTVAIGAFLALVGSVALAWWLNSRREAQTARAAWQGSGHGQDLGPQGGGAGYDLTPDALGDESLRLEPETAGRAPSTVPTGNGAKVDGAVAPLVRRLAREHDIDLDQVQGTGREGRVRPGDVEAFLQRHQRTYATAVDEAGTDQPPGSNGDDGLIGLFTRLDAALAGAPLQFYLESLPQVIAKELTYDAFADFVAVLLENGAGSFEVIAAVGLAADEQHATVDPGHDALRQTHQDGVSVFNDTAQLAVAAAAGIPGSQTAEALILVPLVQGPSWIGTLLVGRRSGTGRQATAFDDQEVADVVLYAMDSVPILNSLLLLRQLQQCLTVLNPSHA